MNAKLLLGLAAAARLVSAQTTVTSMFIYDADPQPLVASVMGVAATATTYYINCPPGTDSSDCGMGPGLTVIAGPQTTSYLMEEPDEDFYWSVACSLQGTTTGSCVEMASGTGANFPGTSTIPLDTDDIASGFMPVTITAGAGSITASGTASATASITATSTGTGASTTATTASASDKSASADANSTTATSAASAASTTTSTGAGAVISNDATLIFGGAAVAALVAAVL
ncbi:uncharacterized protein BO95DRAFT_471605 [Aspergillus brunneoviolaceus CBS 621.78]|uniref:Uncharacterized protein n=1 Tax=Aspergillus brunneoviolaceus CBS 621.78 TaxID=1450534 RepID=A0ACD1GHZ2_9EURO|nr:hypothetical protein BO95DRAFT_471605 [Aspergillus brunneoviolaceus CBS 621.78]RAH48724.1 hypothetical protein BO95DRAFT_471605 [Aspergillus brunneoviolaceus CBS 621.78]